LGNLDAPQSLHKYLYTHADPVNGIDPCGLEFTVSSMMTTTGLQNMIRVGTGYIQGVFRVYNMVDRFKKIIEYSNTMNQLLRFARCMFDGMNGGNPVTQTFITALTQTFNFDSKKVNLNNLFGVFDEILSKVSKEKIKELFHKILVKAPEMSAKAISHQSMVSIIQAILGQEDMVVVIGLPSPPTSVTNKHVAHWIKFKISGEDYALGWSGYSGVLLDLGIAINKPKIVNSFPSWEKGHFRSVVRIDYWNYHNTPKTGNYNPHYHVWDDDNHYYF
jgi:hypothetical protein